MKGISILDCTLRDGGFVNNWDFGQNAILNIVNLLTSSGVEFVEIGYLRDDARPDRNRCVFRGSDEMHWVLAGRNSRAKIVAMIDYGSCSIANISVKTNRQVDGIRVTFKKHEIDDALSFCKQIKDKGYSLFMQPVNITDYTDQELLDLIEKINTVNPFAVSIVDTYGFMQKHDIVRLFYLFDHNLSENIQIGYHSHNNLQLAYSNSVELFDLPSQRDIIIDTSVYGMGKSAGNAGTELVASFLNLNFNKEYQILNFLELIDSEIGKYKAEGSWGYSLQYYMAATYKCHPSYVKYLLRKKALTVVQIVELLASLDSKNKTVYVESHIEMLYRRYELKDNDIKESVHEMERLIQGKNVLIIAPGKTAVTEMKHIVNYQNSNQNVVTILVNCMLENLNADALFISNAKRFEQCMSHIRSAHYNIPVWVTSNIRKETHHFQLNLNQLIHGDYDMIDNGVLLLLSALIQSGASRLYLAGMDGFCEDSDNYASKYLVLRKTNEFDASGMNEKVRAKLDEFSKQANIVFLTESIYENDRYVKKGEC